MGAAMNLLICILVPFLVIILVLYLINMLPIDGGVPSRSHALSSSSACCRC